MRHGFTHFELEIEVYVADISDPPPPRREVETRTGSTSPRGEGGTKARWVHVNDLGAVALPTVMRKILTHALDDGGPLFSGKARA